jgi:hypothetical protein
MSQELLFSIFGASEQHNQEKEITGLLLATDKHFLQVLEGDKRAINELYHNIVKDIRHNEIQILSFQQIEKRSFPEWSMKILTLKDLSKGIRDLILQKYGKDHLDFCFADDPALAFSFLYDLYIMSK